MKIRRLSALFVIFAVIIALLAGCSAAPQENMGGMEVDKAPSDSLSGSYGENTDGSVLTDRKLIRKINMTAETEDMDALLAQVYQRVNELSGYIESRNVQNGSNYSGGRTRYATLTVRIPADKLDQFVEQVSDVSNIISTVETSDDVTLKYVATESRLKVLQAEEERLLEFLSKAETVKEMLEIEARLTNVRAELESIASQLKVYDNLVDYGTVTLRIDEVKEYTVVEEEDPTLWERISNGFMNSLRALGKLMEGLVVLFFIVLPFLLPLALVGGIVLLIYKLRKRRR
ncbi:MAG: DUF4349 domain-containing protein [Oscillospiraceae bacterium]|nr:DUF4349 domain-containing protein [Oscillospiraceae bacterium]